MRTGSRSFFLSALFLVLLLPQAGSTASDSSPEEPRFKGKYLGKTAPGLTPRVFDQGDLTGDVHSFNLAFSPDGQELFFSHNRSAAGNSGPVYEIKHMRSVDGTWERPRTAFFSGEAADADITFSPDGQKVFFASDRPHAVTADMDIYYLERTEAGWSEPRHAGMEVNTIHNEVYPTFSARENLFFASNRPGGHGAKDLYTAQWIDGRLTNVKNLGPSINTGHLESDCYVAPDESYILFNSIRPENENRIQIYVSFQIERGTWTKAVKLPEVINVEGQPTGFPTLTPDGKYLLYSGRRGEEVAVYWVSTEVIAGMKPRARVPARR